MPKPLATVIVFGDIGHSPRMVNHCRELLCHNYSVQVIAYSESDIPDDLKKPDFNLMALPNYRLKCQFLPSSLLLLFNIAIKLILGFSCILLWLLRGRLGRRGDLVIVQSPPVLPTVPLGWLLAKLQGAKLVADWHNVGYTLLINQHSSLVAIAKGIELWCTKLADANLVVSEAQKQWFSINAGGMASVLYDRPINERFKPVNEEDKKQIRAKLGKTFGWGKDENFPILISSTSWTPDEDFSMFIEALKKITHKIGVIITGKGPLRSKFEEEITRLNLDNISVSTVWLPSEEYPKVLGSCDLGICMHRSSSGVDIPMKVIDMVGVNIPFAAYDYATIHEVVGSVNNPFLFNNADDLATIVNDFLNGRLKWTFIQLEDWSSLWNTVFQPLMCTSKSPEEKKQKKQKNS